MGSEMCIRDSLQALRRVPARFFGVFMSVNPVFAALTGLIVLGQSLAPADWLAIAVIVTVNAVSAGRPAPADGPAPADRRAPADGPASDLVGDPPWQSPPDAISASSRR